MSNTDIVQDTEEKDSIVVYTSVTNAVRTLVPDMSDRCRFYEAMFDFGCDLKEPEFAEDEKAMISLWGIARKLLLVNYLKWQKGHVGKGKGRISK